MKFHLCISYVQPVDGLLQSWNA